jgi:hypothetical protein
MVPGRGQTNVQADLSRPDIRAAIGTSVIPRPRAPLQNRADVDVLPADQGCRENAPNNLLLPAPRPRHLSPRAFAREPVAHRSSIRPPVTATRMISVVPITVAT